MPDLLPGQAHGKHFQGQSHFWFQNEYLNKRVLGDRWEPDDAKVAFIYLKCEDVKEISDKMFIDICVHVRP